MSRTDKLFSIAFAAQWGERMSSTRDSIGAKTLTNDLQREIYLGEVFIMDHSVCKNAEEKKCVIIEVDELNVSRIYSSGQDRMYNL